MPLDPIDKLAVVDLLGWLHQAHSRVTAAVLRREEAQVRGTYVALRNRRFRPRVPILENTDGEPLSLHKLTFRIEDAAAAFEALAELDIMESCEKLLERAERDRSGRLVRVQICWQKPGNAKMPSRRTTRTGRTASSRRSAE